MSQFSELVKKAAPGPRHPMRAPHPFRHAQKAAGGAGKGAAGFGAKKLVGEFGESVVKEMMGKAAPKAAAGIGALSLLAYKKLRPKPTMAQRLSGGLKKALTGKLAKRLGAFGAGAAGIAGGIAVVDALRSGLSSKISDKKQFSNVMKENPTLEKDREHAKKVFKTLKRFNPEMAADPLVAGSFLKRSLQYKDEGIQPMDVKTLTEIGKNMRDRGGDSFLGKIFGDVATAKGLASMAGG